MPGLAKLIGAFDGCADPVACAPAPSPAADYFSAVLFIRDAHRDYILDIAVDGGYHGPDRYQLRSWGDDVGLNAHNRVAKVMLRDGATGAVWQSIAGSLTILPTGTRGMVDAAFEYIDGLPTPPARHLLVSGPWSCG